MTIPADSAVAGFDMFLSHGSPDKPWVRTLRDEIERLGLRPFFDEAVLEPGHNWVGTLGDAVRDSRALILVMSRESQSRPWVDHEWMAYMAQHGPRSGRLIPVLIDPVELPTFLKPVQSIDATDRDATRAAAKLAALVGRVDTLPEGDARRLYIGQDLVFVMDREDGKVGVTDPSGRRRVVDPPWAGALGFTVARLGFNRMTREAVRDDASRAELTGHAATLGGLLFDLIFDGEGRALLDHATRAGRPRPLVSLLSGDDVLLSLPWELLHRDGRFLVRDGVVDLVRSVPGEVGAAALLPHPKSPLSLVVNVSAPEGSGLDHERESYRLTLALTDHCKLTPTELGTLDDLVETVREARPTGVHFSGHGSPGRLLFEDDEGGEAPVRVDDFVDRLRAGLPDGVLPPFFYLASCHGNDPDPGEPEKGRPGVASLAARLHRAGACQVVGYHGPILDHLSTEAEAALYVAIADGHPTRFAVRQARAAMAGPPGGARDVLRGPGAVRFAAPPAHPFAWAQLVLYHRGHDYPLSLPRPAGTRREADTTLRRTFQDAGQGRRVLATGFIGRRRELHDLRRRARKGERVFVIQGLGGLGKSTLALRMVHVILHAGDDLCTLWCQDAEKEMTPGGLAEALVGQLLKFCRARFGSAWEQIVQQVDVVAGDDPALRFAYFLDALLRNVDRLVLYLDNLESLLVGPPDDGSGPPDPAAFGTWHEPALGSIWSHLRRVAEDGDQLTLVATCRYRNTDFRPGYLIPVSPLPPAALFRLMGWFDGLRRLSSTSRARLLGRLDGHPRAVEFTDDLIRHALDQWEEDHGPWRLPDSPDGAALADEWDRLVAPALPEVQAKLWDDLLLSRIWHHVLDDRARAMLHRITLLRRPWEWELAAHLGEPDETPAEAEATARRLRNTSLLEPIDLPTRVGLARHYTIHPATAEFISRQPGDDEAKRIECHGRLGEWYEARAKTSPYIDDDLEAGHHLFQAGLYDRSYELLGSASDRLQELGRVREGLRLLEPFLATAVCQLMSYDRVGRNLGTLGNAHFRLGQAERAIGFHEQALVICREIGDRRGEGNALGNLGIAYARLGQAERAIDFHEQALVISREIGDRRGEGSDLGNLGIAYARLGQTERAIGFYEKQLVICREIGDRRGEGNALGNLGNAYADLGQAERAIDFYEKQLVICREIGDRQGEGNALGNLGSAYVRLGQAERAIDFYEKRLEIAREIGDRRGEGNALGNLGIAYADLGQAERAIGFYEQALVIGTEISDPRIIKLATAGLDSLRTDEGSGDPAPDPDEGA